MYTRESKRVDISFFENECFVPLLNEEGRMLRERRVYDCSALFLQTNDMNAMI
jgi:hypothetical protein